MAAVRIPDVAFILESGAVMAMGHGMLEAMALRYRAVDRGIWTAAFDAWRRETADRPSGDEGLPESWDRLVHAAGGDPALCSADTPQILRMAEQAVAESGAEDAGEKVLMLLMAACDAACLHEMQQDRGDGAETVFWMSRRDGTARFGAASCAEEARIMEERAGHPCIGGTDGEVRQLRFDRNMTRGDCLEDALGLCLASMQPGRRMVCEAEAGRQEMQAAMDRFLLASCEADMSGQAPDF